MDSYRKLLDNKEIFNEHCEKTFDNFDKDKSGFIEANEFVHVMKYFCGEVNLPKLSQCENFDKFRSFDKNKDGRLCIEEFSVLVREVLETAIAACTGSD